MFFLIIKKTNITKIYVLHNFRQQFCTYFPVSRLCRNGSDFSHRMKTKYNYKLNFIKGNQMHWDCFCRPLASPHCPGSEQERRVCCRARTPRQIGFLAAVRGKQLAEKCSEMSPRAFCHLSHPPRPLTACQHSHAHLVSCVRTLSPSER